MCLRVNVVQKYNLLLNKPRILLYNLLISNLLFTLVETAVVECDDSCGHFNCRISYIWFPRFGNMYYKMVLHISFNILQHNANRFLSANPLIDNQREETHFNLMSKCKVSSLQIYLSSLNFLPSQEKHNIQGIKLIIHLHKAIVRPHLEYCIQPYRKKDLDTLKRIQRRALKLFQI